MVKAEPEFFKWNSQYEGTRISEDDVCFCDLLKVGNDYAP